MRQKTFLLQNVEKQDLIFPKIGVVNNYFLLIEGNVLKIDQKTHP